MHDRKIDVAVAIVVGRSDAAGHLANLKEGAAHAAAVVPGGAGPLEELGLLGQQGIAGKVFDVAVGDEEIHQAIGIKVAEDRAEAEPRQRRRVQANKPGDVFKAGSA